MFLQNCLLILSGAALWRDIQESCGLDSVVNLTDTTFEAEVISITVVSMLASKPCIMFQYIEDITCCSVVVYWGGGVKGAGGGGGLWGVGVGWGFFNRFSIYYLTFGTLPLFLKCQQQLRRRQRNP